MRNDSGLEKKLNGYSPYKSKGERKVAEVLDSLNLDYTYEPRVLVEEKNTGDTEKARLWYPDFFVKNLGIIIEYVGMPENKEYMKGIERKRETYERMGLKVVYINKDDIFEKDNNYQLRRDYRERIAEKIYSVGKSSDEIEEGTIGTGRFNKYRYAA